MGRASNFSINLPVEKPAQDLFIPNDGIGKTFALLKCV
jgi:hypothetical protein